MVRIAPLTLQCILLINLLIPSQAASVSPFDSLARAAYDRHIAWTNLIIDDQVADEKKEAALKRLAAASDEELEERQRYFRLSGYYAWGKGAPTAAILLPLEELRRRSRILPIEEIWSAKYIREVMKGQFSSRFLEAASDKELEGLAGALQVEAEKKKERDRRSRLYKARRGHLPEYTQERMVQKMG